tara:strand:+ start:119 stop:778 length:660 start_codon:yes stop_codon:yes gene_type:complete
LPSKKNKNTSVLGLWLVPISAPLKPITQIEENWAEQFSATRKKEYQHSRGYARFALSELFGVHPFQIPLHAEPGKVPELEKGWGYISISHCSNASLIGWAPRKLGIDLERANRSFNQNLILNRFFCEKEKDFLKMQDKNNLRKNVLSRWVLKEAAIKWQRGHLFQDLVEWESSKDYDWAKHRSLNYKVNTQLINYKSWIIAVAYDKKIHSKTPILCIEK